MGLSTLLIFPSSIAIPINVETIGLTIENEDIKEVSAYLPAYFSYKIVSFLMIKNEIVLCSFTKVSRATLVGFNDLLVKPITCPNL